MAPGRTFREHLAGTLLGSEQGRVLERFRWCCWCCWCLSPESADRSSCWRRPLLADGTLALALALAPGVMTVTRRVKTNQSAILRLTSVCVPRVPRVLSASVNSTFMCVCPSSLLHHRPRPRPLRTEEDFPSGCEWMRLWMTSSGRCEASSHLQTSVTQQHQSRRTLRNVEER